MAEHSIETKLEAAIAFLITGNTEDAGAMVNVPGRTIRYWTNQPWWEDIINEAKTVKQKELDAIWTSLIHRAADKLRERILEGDPHLTKDGEAIFMPIKAKDLAFIMAVAVDKRAVMRGQVTSRKETITTEKKLEQIEQAFKGLGKQTENDQPDPERLN
jgi:hypothetical protein